MAAPVVYLSFVIEPREAVKLAVAQLLDDGHDVILVTMRAEAWADLAARPGLRVFDIGAAEYRHPARAGLLSIVDRRPRRVLRGLAAATARRRGVSAAVGGFERGYGKLTGAFDRYVYLRGYRLFRPYVLARLADRAVGRLLPPEVRLIVAADSLAVNYGHWLARRYPAAVASADYHRRPDPAPAAG
ncbi:hypothetical protein GCM10010123_29620 [Pilimelia anulata]|uniref:Uncharacterized protein n=1 Tax=Pilimelia anulata TaxID=53371 RepID=A0A8J3FDV6_9ACTN|nr:hypothetical protein [Pilimelia anulata]GGJ97684.1 hypothetical protein GCM10010123_29620 [Pilimelia anulata]